MSAKHPYRVYREQQLSPDKFSELFSENVVFNSPIFTKPVVGRDLVLEIIKKSVQVRNGDYTDEFRSGNKTVLIWSGEIDGRKLQSFEFLVDDDAGRIVERTVSMRPFPSVQIFRDAMRKSLGDLLTADYWEFSSGI